MLTAGLFGATLETDLILLSQTFAENLQYLFSQVLLTAFTATYIHIHEEGGSTQRIVSDTLKVFSLTAAALMGLTMLFSSWIARIIAPSYSPETTVRLSFYLRLYAPALFLFVWSAVFHALLNANKQFTQGEMTTVNQNILYAILALVLSAHMGANAMVVAFFAYSIWNTVFLGFFPANTGGSWLAIRFKMIRSLFPDWVTASSPLLLTAVLFFLWCPPLFVLSALFCSLMSRRAFPEGNTNRPLIWLFIASAYWFWSFFQSACSLFYAHTTSFPSFLDTGHFMRRLWSPHPPPCGDMPPPLSLWFCERCSAVSNMATRIPNGPLSAVPSA